MPTDENHLIRMDDYEMKPEVQEEVKKDLGENFSGKPVRTNGY